MALIVIENIIPSVDSGKFPVKWSEGELFTVEADIFKEGHDIIGASLKYRRRSDPNWQEIPMVLMGNDHWRASFTPDRNDLYFYTVEAWFNPITTWAQFVEKKATANPNVKSELSEGDSLLEKMARQANSKVREKIENFRKLLKQSDGVSDKVLRIIQASDFKKIVSDVLLKERVTSGEKEFELYVDRKRALCGAWYEMFPRSQGRKKNKSGTFQDCVKRLPEIKKMGFDVIYLPPIHPVGTTNRKGPNNTLAPNENSPGSPWAIGNKEGGHKAIHPELGTMKDFEQFVETARTLNMEIALDFAIQCSPDHSYVKEHPEWFYRLLDGTIRYAENPPKKYEDIYPLNFCGEHRQAIWEEMKSIVLFWVERGVRIFRVDNPHTKPFDFWQWLIRGVQEKYPDVLFLAEAFTRPKIMKYLAKAGFSQSYTYFTWRNSKWELQEYLEELTQTDMKYYFRGNFFVNTPDILHEILQKGGRPAFKMRLVLAATLSSNYGIYSGYELCENAPIRAGSEEYLNSEKYEYKVWDWDRPGHIKDFIARVNQIRNENPAFWQYANLRFIHSCNDQILCYGKNTADGSNPIIVVVNLDPFRVQEDLIHVPVWEYGIETGWSYQVEDLITGEKFWWRGEKNYIRLDPQKEPAHILRIVK